MTKRFFRTFFLVISLFLSASSVRLHAADHNQHELEFFETKIRPVLAENCFRCHSEKAEKLKGGLRLDTPEALLKGGDSGPAIVAGDPETSLLIKAVRYLDPDLQMPPKNKKLPAEQIASLEAWVKMGAPMPRPAATGPRPLTDITEARVRHWAFQPITKPGPPAVKRSRWVQTPIDNFVLATLEQKHLKPSPQADRRTLIRRVTYDLVGLPPAFEEVEAFIKDKRPDAYARVVDRLLASPHYGERWGRYWLDVARYADTKGYLAGGEERRYPFSYTYRDYVIRAFNEDKPYDQFVIEQIAADLLPGAPASLPAASGEQLAGRDAGAPGGDRRNLAALGFLTLGRRFLNNQNDIIDDRIDVVTRGTLGLTVTCSRCHDHKFDPISSKDYYALHGVFASSEEPSEEPLLSPVHDSPEYQDYLKQKAAIEKEIVDFKEREIAQFMDELRHRVGDYLLGAHDAPKPDDTLKFETFAGERKLNPAMLRRWITDLDARAKHSDPIFAPWFDLVNLTNVAPSLSAVNALVAKALAEQGSNSLERAASVYSKLFQTVDEDWKAAVTAAAKENKPVPTALPSADAEAVRQVLYTQDSAVNLPKTEAEAMLSRRLTEGTAPIRNRVEALGWTHPGAPARAMAIVDRSSVGNSHVLIRGNPGTPGQEVPRRFLEVLSVPGQTPPPFTNGSGRLELARAIVSRDNPLTARVYVNRIWQHHFGEGLVSTAGDFGVRTPEPVHHALLDYLAATLMENGWSAKHLHRMILLSSTYQQSSEADVASLKADPENALLSRMNRERLDFEALRDTLLALAGKLDLKLGGLPLDLQSEPFPARRSVYGLIERQNLPGLLRTFDFANPDTSSQGRFHTTVPQQALFMMNSPFVIEQARALAQRPEVSRAKTPDDKIQALYHVVLQRRADREELRLVKQFVARQSSLPGATFSPMEKFAQILLFSNELMFVD
ncbi:MAG: hypothetical protein QOJ40_76 [Verrucomicrobiota bacterium]